MENGENEKNSGEETLPKITYTDKMIVSVMGAVFNVLLALVLSCILGIFGYERRRFPIDDQDRLRPGHHRALEPACREGRANRRPAKKAGLSAGDRIKSVDGIEVEDFMQIQSLIVTGKGMTEEAKGLLPWPLNETERRKSSKSNP